MQVQRAERIDEWRDGRWRAVVIVVERARSTERAADTQRQRQILRPTHHPSAVGETEWDHAALLRAALRALAEGILTGWGFPHSVRETSPGLPTDRLRRQFPVSAVSATHHTQRTRLPRTSVRDTVRTSARSSLSTQAAVVYVGLRRGLPAEQYIETLLGALFPHGAGLRREQDCPALVLAHT
jgi:hypothetical protein